MHCGWALWDAWVIITRTAMKRRKHSTIGPYQFGEERKDEVQGQAEQAADSMKQAAIGALPTASPSAGSFVITSMNGASLNHLPSSMSHF